MFSRFIDRTLPFTMDLKHFVGSRGIYVTWIGTRERAQKSRETRLSFARHRRTEERYKAPSMYYGPRLNHLAVLRSQFSIKEDCHYILLSILWTICHL